MLGKKEKITIGLLNPQGHVRWNNLQIAAHPDTGGQIVYILELAKELGKIVDRVDIFVRYFRDPLWPGYEKEIDEYAQGLRIIRVKCGPESKFVRKEDLWQHISEFAERIQDFYLKQHYLPDVFMTNYADGGLAGAILKKKMKVPFIHTGHSLGGKKMDNLKLSNNNFKEVNDHFKFHLRISAERISFRNSAAIVTSTQEEVDKQYGHKVYRQTIENTEKFNIIPPGIDPDLFFSYHSKENDIEKYSTAVKKLQEILDSTISKKRNSLPYIFSAARFDAKKNPLGLIRAYAESESLQENSNLLIVAGKVEDPLEPENHNKFEEKELTIIKGLIAIINKFELEGKVCISPGFDYSNEMPFIYRYAARNNWIFINPALHEPFGLTIVEAMASGLPVVATKHGGPAEILGDEEYGILVEPTDWHSIRGGLEKMLLVRFWKRYSQAGMERVCEKYTWKTAAASYVGLIGTIMKKGYNFKKDFDIPPYFLYPKDNDDTRILERFKKLYHII